MTKGPAKSRNPGKGPPDGARGGRNKLVAQNKKARHDYSIEDVVEAGLVLTGTEVKSLRQGRCSLTDAFALVDGGEMWLHAAHIPEYTEGTWNNHTPRRVRKLLLHRKEIESFAMRTREGGLAIVPLSLYFKDGRAKVELALGRGRKSHDKRQVLAERDAQKEIRNAMGRALKRGAQRGQR